MKTILTAALTTIALAAFPAGAGPKLPAAIYTDPPRDAAHPARNEAVWIDSGGAKMNGVMMVASGAGPHPTVVMYHGLPGIEENLDLAQALRRAGYNVLTFHYRGNFGSGGAFSLTHAAEDGAAALAFVEDPANVTRFAIDPRRLVVVGHSMGGHVATEVAAAHPEVSETILIAPWDYSADVAMLSVTGAAFDKLVAEGFTDLDGRLGTTTGADIAHEIADPAHDWHLARFAPKLAGRPVLVLTGSRDDDDSRALALRPALKAAGAKVTAVEMPTDHPFSDHRIALETAILGWLK